MNIYFFNFYFTSKVFLIPLLKQKISFYLGIRFTDWYVLIISKINIMKQLLLKLVKVTMLNFIYHEVKLIIY